MTVTAPATGPEDLNRLRIGAIAAARPVGTADSRVLAAIRAVPCRATRSCPALTLPTPTAPIWP